MRAFFDLVLGPFAGRNPWWALLVVSLISAVLALLVYKRVSNQDAIERVKRKMQASLFEIRLFNDDLRAIMRAQGAFLLANLRYLGLNLKPLLWLLVPFVLIFLHLEPRFRYEAFAPGKTAIVKAHVAPAGDGGGGKLVMELRVPDGLRVTSPPVWSLRPVEGETYADGRSVRRGEMAWRVAADEPGLYEVKVAFAGAEHVKEIRFGDRMTVQAPVRPLANFFDQLAHPAERPLPGDAGLEAIEVAYSERDWGHVPKTDVAIAWWFWWLVLMVGFGLLLRGPMGVQI